LASRTPATRLYSRIYHCGSDVSVPRAPRDGETDCLQLHWGNFSGGCGSIHEWLRGRAGELANLLAGSDEGPELVPDGGTVAVQVETSRVVLLYSHPFDIVLMPLGIVAEDDPSALRDNGNPDVVWRVVLEFHCSPRIVKVLDPKRGTCLAERLRQSLPKAPIEEEG
jgi:hypothetical protein